MKTSIASISLIKKWEGLEKRRSDGRIEAYKDIVGVWTIGYGHTAAAGLPHPVLGMIITKDEADEILTRDLVQYERGVLQMLTRTPTQAQFDALVSLAFNVGVGAVRSSTLVRLFNSGDTKGAAEQFLRWNKAGGKFVKGLMNRRQEERTLFLSQTKESPVVSAPIPDHVPTIVAPKPLGLLARLFNLFRKK